MNRWRLAMAVLLLGLLGLPLAQPFFDLGRQTAAWQVWEGPDRLLELAENTGLLIVGTLALALPAGVVGAVLLYRTDLPWRGLLRFLTLLTLFVPLPLFASAWQAALGTGGLLPLGAWITPDQGVATTAIPWKPWGQGLPAAIWVHAVAGLPWIVLIVGQGLCWVERELEEDALLCTNPLHVLWAVTLPRCRAAIAAAALWVGLQTATEITVTDMMQVRTFAEEVYVQFVLGRETLARAVAVSLPGVALSAVLVVWAARRWERALPPLESIGPPLCLFHLGKTRWPWLGLMLATVALLAGIPLLSLVWKAGLSGSPQSWSGPAAWLSVARVPETNGSLLLTSCLIALAAGIVAAGLALVICWLGVETRWFRNGVLILMAVAWALPAPVIGIGMKETINRILDAEDLLLSPFGSDAPRWAADALYYGPSFLPGLWVNLLRFLPCAVAILWPMVRLVPRELRDAVRVDGARPWQELCYLTWPLTRRAWLRAALAVAVLSLGELGAGKLLETPGSRTFAHEVFSQMHYGVTNSLAGLCLVLLLLVGLGGAAVGLAGRVAAKSARDFPWG